MKASVVLPGFVALSTLLLASGQAAPPTAVAWIIAMETAGQAPAPVDARRQADDLLRQARAALKSGQFDQADALIVQAEKTGVVYSDFDLKIQVDTPAKLKALAAEERAKAGGARKPSSMFPPLFGQNNQPPASTPAPPADPFAARNAREQAVNNITAGSAPQNNPTQPFVQNPADLMARNEAPLPLLPNSVGPPPFAAAGPAPNANPYSLPVDGNPLARPALPLPGPNQTVNQSGAPSPDQLADLNLPAPRDPSRPDEPPQRLPAPPFVAPGMPQQVMAAKGEAMRLVAEGRLALDKGDLARAEQLAKQADKLNVPTTAFARNETQPWQLMLEVDRAIRQGKGVQQAGAIEVVGEGPRYPVSQGAYNPANDRSRLQPASGVSSAIMRQQPAAIGAAHPMRLYQEGIQALEAQDRETAIKKFSEAWKSKDQLDPALAKDLGDKLTFLRANTAPAQPLPRPEAPATPISPLEQVGSAQELTRQRLQREFSNEQKAAEQLAQTDPRGALAKIKNFRDRVTAADMDTTARKNLLTLVDRRAAELQTYIDNNKATIDNNDNNRQIRAERARNQDLTLEIQNKLANLVEQFNKLMDERRYHEAIVVAKQAKELAPDELVTTTMIEKGHIAVKAAADASIRERNANGFVDQMQSIGESGIPFDDREPIVFNPKRWKDLTRSRRSLLEQRSRLSGAELEIQKSLSTPVEVSFENRPLSEVVSILSDITRVNIVLDPQGLNAEGITVDTPVTLKLNHPISLRSALQLLLTPLRLSHVIQSEVLLVTSQQTRDLNVFHKVYYVADLVVPIPNFTPTYNMGIAGALKESLATLGYGGAASPLARTPLTLASENGQPPGTMNPTTMGHQAVLAQQQGASQNGMFPSVSGRQAGLPAPAAWAAACRRTSIPSSI